MIDDDRLCECGHRRSVHCPDDPEDEFTGHYCAVADCPCCDFEPREFVLLDEVKALKAAREELWLALESALMAGRHACTPSNPDDPSCRVCNAMKVLDKHRRVVQTDHVLEEKG